MNEDISPILTKVRERCGVDFAGYRDGTLRRRISRRCLACDCSDIAAYLALLDSDPAECDRLLRDLTIKYTEFFRDCHVFDIIRNLILPAIGSRDAAIWSAGCATGEEAYSLAALILSMQRFKLCHSRVSIVATDVDPEALNIAREGCYVKNYLPRLPLDEAMPYFEDDGSKITTSASLKEMVSFHTHDLLAADGAERMQAIRPEGFDLILCRNVLIYLQRSAQERVVQLLLGALRPGGFLVLGTGETLPKSVVVSLDDVNNKARVYRRPLSSEDTEVV